MFDSNVFIVNVCPYSPPMVSGLKQKVTSWAKKVTFWNKLAELFLFFWAHLNI